MRYLAKQKPLDKIKENPITYSLKDVPIDQVAIWDEAQARKIDSTGIDSLARSIKEEGLQNPPMVQRNGTNSYLLMAGQRRLAAVQRLGSKTIPVLILSKNSSCSTEDARAVSIIENMHRRDMSPSEMTASCQFLAERLAAAAKALGINRRTFREYLGYGAVPDKIKEMVKKILSKRDAIRIYKIIPAELKALEIIQVISKYNTNQKRRYIDALGQLGATAEHSKILKLANSFRARHNISLRLSRTQAKDLSKISREQNLEPDELAQKIVADYLS